MRVKRMNAELKSISTFIGVSLIDSTSPKLESFINTNLYLFLSLAIILRLPDIFFPLSNKSTKIPFLFVNYSMRLHRALFFISISAFIWSCGNSDSWLSRQWHNTTAHYNTYFNAREKWNETYNAVREGYKNDFRTFLEPYNYGTAEGLKGNQGAMDEVIKKVSTMIDKHPRSRWVDDAYLLLGKAWFLKGDFFAASEIFQHVNSSYKDPKIRFESRLWIFQCLYMRGKYAEAEDLLKAIKQDKEFPAALNGEINKALTAVMLKQGKIIQAAEYIEAAVAHPQDKLDKYRLKFLAGQIYFNLKQYDKAEAYFSKVMKMNTPYDIAFNSRINLVQILTENPQGYVKSNKILKRMLRDDKNIDYYGQIYYRMGQNELKAGNNVKAIQDFNLSLRKGAGDNAQMTTTYLALGDYFYKTRNFEKAGLYYDSANAKLDEKHPDYKSIAAKGLQLSELIRHLMTIKKEDSLLRLAADPVLREKTIDKLIELEKKRAAEKKNQPATPPPPPTDPGAPGIAAGGSFPFYNTSLRTKGLQEFQAYWGNRENKDFWRISAKKNNGTDNPDPGAEDKKDSTEKENPGLPGDVPADRKPYYKEIPFTSDAKKEALNRIEESLFEAAGIYQNQLGETKEAIRYYEELLARFTKAKNEPQILYELTKLYFSAGDSATGKSYKQKLQDKHPGSAYLKLLNGGGKSDNTSTEGPVGEKKETEELYNKMFQAYKDGKYKEAMQIKLEADRKFAGNALQSRFDYIYALSVFKSGDTAKGMQLIRQVAADYAGTVIGTQAQGNAEAWARISSGKAGGADDTAKAGSGELFKTWDGKEELFFLLVYQKGANSNLLRAALNDFNKENFAFETLEVSPARASGETVYISVANFSKPEKAKEYVDFLKNKTDFFASKGLFEYEVAWISKSNYMALASNNRILTYMEFYRGKVK